MPRTKGSKNKKQTTPTCGHPEALHWAKGLCKRCYNNKRNHSAGRRAWRCMWEYKLTEEEYEALAKVKACALCGRSDIRLCIDHNHETGKVRGVLCHICNTSLGHYELMTKNPKLKEYLQLPTQAEPST